MSNLWALSYLLFFPFSSRFLQALLCCPVSWHGSCIFSLSLFPVLVEIPKRLIVLSAVVKAQRQTDCALERCFIGQSVYCFCRGLELGSQHPCWVAHNYLWLQHPLFISTGSCTRVHYTHTHLKKSVLHIILKKQSKNPQCCVFCLCVCF